MSQIEEKPASRPLLGAFPQDRRPYLFKDGSKVLPHDASGGWSYVTPAGHEKGPFKTLELALEGRLWSQSGTWKGNHKRAPSVEDHT